MKLTRYESGSYRWKNGIKVERTARNEWTVYWCCGDIAYIGTTLSDCKAFLRHTYGSAFTF